MSGTTIMLGTFFVLLFLGMPIAITIGISTALALMVSGMPIAFISQLAFSSLDSFVFLAIPLFIMAGYVMEVGGLSRRIVDFASSLIGRVTGGLGIVTVLACMFFAAISGSSPATVAAIGTMMIPSMVRRGYDANFAGGLTACAGSLGIMIPPSIPMIVYAISADLSIGKMFVAGVVPGALIGAGLIAVAFFLALRRGYKGSDQPFSWRRVARTGWDGKWALLTPIVVLGGIYSGVFTPTEAACVTVVYTLIVSLFIYKDMRLRDLYVITSRSAMTTGTVMIILGFAMAFARYLTIMQVPNEVAEFILQITDNPTVIMLMFVVMIFITGMFMDTTAQILIYTPLLLPVLVKLGVDPYHFGIILIVGTELGLITPPVGVNVFIAKTISGTRLVDLALSIIPFVASMLIIQILMVFLPQIVTFVPNLLYP
ncbi:TRAP transporter large permease [Consotaella salsifontis]|uniref:TRAP transporter large permease protein n=1 Tax=Consotaella salsifontis TaxID=1365950 RepID=A0A1T4MH22_9HYPH|nr:TRAP transporter large permease [Consotaella salsifontis]SJZ66213.1 C4-dicarboxylate transporter, DctM subunit [Consotaella salsifontis]